MILLAHPTGNENVRQAALAFSEAAILEEFWTCLSFPEKGKRLMLLPARVRRELARRALPDVLRSKVRAKPWREVGRLLADRLRVSWLTRHESGACCIDAVYQGLDRAAAQRLESACRLRAVYAYEDGALHLFQAAKRRGIVRYYDLPIGYWRVGRRIAAEEAERLPEWKASMPSLVDSDAKLQRKDEELCLADTIITASQFTAQTLREAPFALPEAVVIPYGCPVPAICDDISPKGHEQTGKRLRVLFVGSLSQRKGLYEVFRSVEALNGHVDLTVVGQRVGDCPERDRRLREHRWIATAPHAEILRLMRMHDVLLFPSLFEGFGLVITEALSQGLPVITTTHTAGPDILTDGSDGFLIPIRDWEAIAGKLEFLHRNRDLLAAMKERAVAKARVLSWESYRLQIAQVVMRTLNVSRSSECIS